VEETLRTKSTRAVGSRLNRVLEVQAMMAASIRGAEVPPTHPRLKQASIQQPTRQKAVEIASLAGTGTATVQAQALSHAVDACHDNGKRPTAKQRIVKACAHESFTTRREAPKLDASSLTTLVHVTVITDWRVVLEQPQPSCHWCLPDTFYTF
jgi:hypothetical protein